MIINTNLPCALGEVLGPMYAIGHDEAENVRGVVLREATYEEWREENPTLGAPFFRYGYYYEASFD